MKRKKASFTGSRPIFTGSPSIVPGGFNLDVANQSFKVGDTIPQGTVAKFDEQTRLVQILKTAEVVDVDTDDNKIVSLRVAEFFEPCFVVGAKVAKADVLYVGDSGVDMETARRACVDSAGVTWGFRPEKALIEYHAGTIVNSPDQILNLVETGLPLG